MIYIKMHGRLGNQFFQYAFARTLAEQRQDQITIDFSNIEEESAIDPYGGWENSLQYYNISKDTVIGSVMYTKMQRLAVLFRKHGFRMYRQFDKGSDNEVRFNEQIIDKLANYGILIANGFHEYTDLPLGDLILDGYFECPKYFAAFDTMIRNEFTPKYAVQNKNKVLYDKICCSESVCITIRRGDFIYKAGVAKAANLCTKEYFYAGIEYMYQKIREPQLIVFSDDIPWVQENMKFPKGTLYENGSDPVWEKMQLMSACKHFVISNSTFSWWAQYLSTYKEKIVVAPNKWRREGYDGHSLYDDKWKLIPVK